MRTKIVMGIFIITAAAAHAQYSFYKIEYYFNPIDLGITYFYKINLNSDKTGKIIYSIKKDSTRGEASIYEFTITNEAKNEINRTFIENNIIETENQFADDNEFRNSGETEFARISYIISTNDSSLRPTILKPMSTPIFPREELRERLKNFYAKINAAVPEEVWRRIKN